MEKKNRDVQGLILAIIGYLILIAFILCTAFVIAGRWIDGVASKKFFDEVDIFTSSADYNPWLRSLSYIVCIFSISYCVRLLLKLSSRWLKHGLAVVSLLCSFLKYVAAIIILFFILSAFGVDTKALVAGLGILSLIVGLAIQPLLQDIIAGIFVVFEKTYDVGDVVVVDSFRGTVVEIGIRTTKLKDAGGDIKVINNSDIRTLVNMTSDLSLAISEVDIEYSESLERVEGVILANLPRIRENIPDIVDGPEYKGVVALGAHGVTLRLCAQCKEKSKFQTQRDMNRQIKLIFDENGVGIPYPQVVVHHASSSPMEEKNAAEVLQKIMGNFDEEKKVESSKEEIEKEALQMAEDPVFVEALRCVIKNNSASISLLQRKLCVGYNRAGRIIEAMEELGYVSAFDGSRTRKIFITKEEFESKYGQL